MFCSSLVTKGVTILFLLKLVTYDRCMFLPLKATNIVQRLTVV